MSILPKEVNSSSGNSTQFVSSNSLPDDGILQSTRNLINSIADGGSYPSTVSFMEQFGSSGSIDEVAVDSSDNSPQVTDLGILDGQTSFHGEIHVASSEALLDRQEEMSSQVNIEFAGNGCSTHFEQLAASRNPHGNLIPSTSKKNHKISGNHLLNFQYDPISTRPQSKVHPPRKQQKPKPYNKDLFIQANYKFIVLDRGTSTMLSLDPDKLLQWEDVLCVRYSTPFEVQCPICLETPLCPQITTCGHIFCFPCILRYLLMGAEDHKGENWKRCPLCLMMISCKDLYTLYIDRVTLYGVGDLVNFMLLTRRKDSLLLSQKDQNGISCGALCEGFSRFTLTSDIELSVRAAKLELSEWLAKAETGIVQNLEQIPYVCAALEQLEQRKNLWVEYQACSDSLPIRDHSPSSSTKFSKYSTSKHETNPTLISAPTSVMTDGETQDLLNAFDDSHELKWPESNATSAKDSNVEGGIHEHLTGFTCGKETESYTFYQSVDGQNLILHPLNMKCLLYHFGSYDLLPPRLTGEILQLETVIQSEVVRKRYRYLSHLPLTTSFQLCEINLREILPPPAFSPFIDEIKKRENQRKRLAKKEQEQKARAEVLDAASRKSDCHHSLQNNPGFSHDDFEALGGYAMSSTSPPVGEKKLFADVTRLGFAAAHDSPSLKNDSHSPFGTSTMIASGGHSNGNTSYQRNPSTSSFAAIINKSSQNIPVQQTNRLEKKGKKQSRVLLSTAGGRRY